VLWRMEGKLAIKVRRYVQSLDFTLSERCDKLAIWGYFRNAIDDNGVPLCVANDKSVENLAGLEAVNVILKFIAPGQTVTPLQIKCPNSTPKLFRYITRRMLDFKTLHSASATLNAFRDRPRDPKEQIRYQWLERISTVRKARSKIMSSACIRSA